MAKKCVNCGNQVRPGAKFCGICGFAIGDLDKSVHLPGSTASSKNKSGEVAKNANVCPHCRKVNRPGVRFCAHCGKALPLESSLPGKGTFVETGSQSQKRRSPILTLGLIAAALVVVCGSLFLAAWGFGWLDRILLPEKSTTTSQAVVQISTSTQLSPITSTSTIPLDDTNGTKTPTKTVTKVPPSPTITRTLPPSMTPTPEILPAFSDDFNGTLDQWYAWENRPGELTQNLFLPSIKGNEYLDLVGYGYDKVGVTALQTTTIASGVVIEFSAEVVENILEPKLYFDWYPGVEARQPYRIGPFFLVIDSSEAVFHYTNIGIDQECVMTSEGTGTKLYRIIIGSDWTINISIGDGADENEMCSVIIDELPDTVGRITFSGFGFIDNVKIFEP
jgi:uncharacterized OB-fold protein